MIYQQHQNGTIKKSRRIFLYTGAYHERIYHHQSRRRTDAFQVPLQTPAPGSGKPVPQKLPQETFHTFSEKKNADPSQKKSAFPFSRRIIYEDEHILIVDKPAGILTQSDNSNELSLNDALLDYCHYNNHSTVKPSVCNRLDRNTSGIVLCGKTVKGLQMLNEIIKNRTLHKYYRCIVLGETKEQDTLKGFLKKNESANQVTIITEQKDNAVPIETNLHHGKSGEYLLSAGSPAHHRPPPPNPRPPHFHRPSYLRRQKIQK